MKRSEGEASKGRDRKIPHRLPPVDTEMRMRAQELRNAMTIAERRLWAGFRESKLNARFHRQRVVGRYICDFVSIGAGLIIEVDGGQHYQPTNVDGDRTRERFFSELGFRTLRFSNDDVLQNLEGVMEAIRDCIDEAE